MYSFPIRYLIILCCFFLCHIGNAFPDEKKQEPVTKKEQLAFTLLERVAIGYVKVILAAFFTTILTGELMEFFIQKKLVRGLPEWYKAPKEAYMGLAIVLTSSLSLLKAIYYAIKEGSLAKDSYSYKEFFFFPVQLSCFSSIVLVLFMLQRKETTSKKVCIKKKLFKLEDHEQSITLCYNNGLDKQVINNAKHAENKCSICVKNLTELLQNKKSKDGNKNVIDSQQSKDRDHKNRSSLRLILLHCTQGLICDACFFKTFNTWPENQCVCHTILPSTQLVKQVKRILSQTDSGDLITPHSCFLEQQKEWKKKLLNTHTPREKLRYMLFLLENIPFLRIAFVCIWGFGRNVLYSFNVFLTVFTLLKVVQTLLYMLQTIG